MITRTEIRARQRTPRLLDLDHLAAIAHALDPHATPAGNIQPASNTNSPLITPTVL
jgi:hypothetical protein